MPYSEIWRFQTNEFKCREDLVECLKDTSKTHQCVFLGTMTCNGHSITLGRMYVMKWVNNKWDFMGLPIDPICVYDSWSKSYCCDFHKANIGVVRNPNMWPAWLEIKM